MTINSLVAAAQRNVRGAEKKKKKKHKESLLGEELPKNATSCHRHLRGRKVRRGKSVAWDGMDKKASRRIGRRRTPKKMKTTKPPSAKSQNTKEKERSAVRREGGTSVSADSPNGGKGKKKTRRCLPELTCTSGEKSCRTTKK